MSLFPAIFLAVINKPTSKCEFCSGTSAGIPACHQKKYILRVSFGLSYSEKLFAHTRSWKGIKFLDPVCRVNTARSHCPRASCAGGDCREKTLSVICIWKVNSCVGRDIRLGGFYTSTVFHSRLYYLFFFFFRFLSQCDVVWLLPQNQHTDLLDASRCVHNQK